jgi:hypothetical protein
MNNHTKLTQEQYDAVTRAREAALNSGAITRHRPLHNFPLPIEPLEWGETSPSFQVVKDVTQLQFTVSALDAIVTEQRSTIHDLVDRLAKLEAKEFARNLPSNQAARGESE